jgi:protein-tyrosine phosphatase
MSDAARKGVRALFVCSGNICRSPMAIVIAERILAEEGIPVEWLESGGTLGIQGEPAAANAQLAVRELGLDLTSHRSKGVGAVELDGADYIVVMAREHEREILMRRPDAEPRIVRLWEYTNRSGRLKRIADPIGNPFGDYAACRSDLLECIRNWAGQLKTDSRITAAS